MQQQQQQQENRNEDQQDNIIQGFRSTALYSHQLQLGQSYEYHEQATGMEDIRGKLRSPAMYPPQLQQVPSQRIEDIRGCIRSPAIYSQLQRGHNHAYPQGMENIRGKLESPAMFSQVQQVPGYGFGQGIEDIRGKLKSPAMHPAEPQQVPRFGSGQGIENIRGKLISPAMYHQLQQGPRDEKKRIYIEEHLKEMESLIRALKSHIELQQKPRKRSPDHAIESQKGLKDIDVKDITSYSYDVLEAVEYEYQLGIDNFFAKEKSVTRPEVLQVVEYFNLHDVNKVRLKALKELVLLTEEYDGIEKHPQAQDKMNTLEAVLRICDAVGKSKTTVSST